MFVLQTVPTLDPDPSATLQMTATAEPWELHSGTSKSDLTLFMARYPDGLSATFEYDTDLFDAERIQRMAEHFLLLLEAAVSNPCQPISSLPLPHRTERPHPARVELRHVRLPPRPVRPRALLPAGRPYA